MEPVVTTLLICLAVPLVALQLLVIIGMASTRRRSTHGPARFEPGADAELPSFSVILPAHNESSRLPATLAALERVRYAGEHEFVIVDDRSSDGTAAIIDSFVERDPRFRRLSVETPDRRYAPKVNAVMRGLAVASGELIATTDADCKVPESWLTALAAEFTSDVDMVSGYVEVGVPGGRQPLWRLIEAADWFALMLTSRSLLRFGHAFASSANNQAYRRSSFDAANGFGASARAPSADEDLLAQRLGRLPGGRVVFATAPGLRVTTRSVGGTIGFLRQRARWVSRYRHVIHYQPGFIAGLAVLGFESIALCLAVLATLFRPDLAPTVFSVYAIQIAAHTTGMIIGARQLGRSRMGGWVAFIWATLHPWIIAVAVIWSAVAPNDWRSGAVGYRRSLIRRRWRLLRRALVPR